MTAMPALEVCDLAIAFPRGSGWAKVVDGVSFSLENHESLGIAGESGSGKSLSLLALAALIPPPGRVVGGQVQVAGVDVLAAGEPTLKQLRGGVLGFVWQQPASAFNPVLSVGRQVAEAALLHGSRAPEARERALELLAAVGLEPPAEFFRAYPHQLSGGQLQRAALAAALSGKPQIVVLDEPTSALDALAQAAFVTLLEELSARFRLSLILATHDLGLLARLCQRLVVLATGETVEEGPAQKVLEEPLHPATAMLAAGSRAPAPLAGAAPGEGGEGPRPAGAEKAQELGSFRPGGTGCRFAPRCPWVFARCWRERPALATVGEGRAVRCFLHHGESCRG